MATRFPPTFIQEVLARTDIVDLINHYLPVPLKKSGNSYKACCPFHEEKTPSFSVSPDKGLYYCFGCHASGTAITFLVEHQRMSFPDAVAELARNANLELPRSTESPQDAARFDAMRQAMNTVARFYQSQLKANTKASEYLASRGISDETAEDFAIGYAPAQHALKKCFKENYDEKLLLEIGLLARGEQSIYERFRDRLMFPIRERRGDVIAFGGRLLSDSDGAPKYINSPETPLFKKRYTLYGLYELKNVRKLDSLLFVEGYMDLVSLAQHGVANVVAALGTATTQTHIRTALRLAPNLIFCFDGDTAGNKAAVEAAQQALAAFTDGCSIRLMFMPAGTDPDSFIQQHGVQQFNQALSQAVPLDDFLFAHYAAGLDLKDNAQATRFARQLKPLLQKLPKGFYREKVFRRLEKQSGISIKTLEQDDETRQSRLSSSASSETTLYSTIKVALRLLLENPKLASYALETESIRSLQKPGAKLLADVIDNIVHNKLSSTASVIECYRDSRYEESLNRLATSKQIPTASQLEFEDAMLKLKIELTEQQITDMQKASLDNAKEKKEIEKLLRDLLELKNKNSHTLLK